MCENQSGNNDDSNLNDAGIERNTAELGKIILGLSTAGIGLLKFKTNSLSLLEQLSATSFLISIVSLFFAYWVGSHNGVKIIKWDNARDSLILGLNVICNLAFLAALILLIVTVW